MVECIHSVWERYQEYTRNPLQMGINPYNVVLISPNSVVERVVDSSNVVVVKSLEVENSPPVGTEVGHAIACLELGGITP